MAAFLQGVSLGAGHAVAVAPQNAYILRAGLHGRHAVPAALGSGLADAALAGLGAGGLGPLLASLPLLPTIAAWAGAAYLFWHGLTSYRAALRPRPRTLKAAATAAQPQTAAGAAVAAATFVLLSPHAYLDTVVIFGSLAAQLEAPNRLLLTLGAGGASLVWYLILAVGAARLAPVLNRPQVWRILDGLVGTIMWLIAATLVQAALSGPAH